VAERAFWNPMANVSAIREGGVITGVGLQISPPFVITEDEIATLGRVLAESLGAAA
jgi:hypothetical protein